MTIPDSKERRAPYLLFLVFLCFSAVIVAAGYAYYGNYAQDYRADVERQLSAIADLKADELVLWKKERLGDAAIFHDNKAFASLVRQFFQDPENASLRRQIEAWLSRVQAAYRYDRLMLLDSRYTKRIVVPHGPERPVSYVSPQTSNILRSGQVAFEDFYWNDEKQKIYLKMLVPVLAEGLDGPLVGALALRIDPENYLYPFLVRWPTSSPTAETLLVRREGDDAVFLSEPRFQKNLALRLRIPLTMTESPLVRGALGQEGIMEGTDHRGARVIAAVRTVPKSPWVMVTCMDLTEVYGPLRERLWLIVALIAALLIGVGGVIGFVWRHQQLRFYAEKYAAATALRESEERYRIAIEGSNDGVAIVQNLTHVYVNRRFLTMFGYDSDEEFPERSPYFAVHPDDRERIKNYAAARTRGEDVPAQYEFKGIKKDGSILYIEVSANAILYQGKPAILAYFRDITPKKHYEERERVSQRKLAGLMDSSPFGLAVVSPEGGFSYVNAKFQELFGYDLADVPDGRAWFRKAYPDREYRRKVVGAWLEDTTNVVPGERIPRLFAVTCKDGAEKMVNIITVKLETGEYLITFEDRTELHRYQQSLEYSAVHDMLTGLLNRRSLGDMLTRAIARAKRGAVSSLLYMDLDNFKDVNDTVGHGAGDEALITLSGMLRQAFRIEDVLFRLGGDEFAVLLEGTGVQEALIAAERLRRMVEAYTFDLGGKEFRLSLSVGLIGIDGLLESKELLSKADAAMYRAKERGKNNIVIA